MVARAGLKRWLLLPVLVCALAAAALAGWWWVIHWAPDRARYPTQGVWLDAASGPVEWATLRASGPGGHGADFVYLTASTGAGDRDPAFAAGFDAARAAGLQVGAVHVYDLCVPADVQASNFVTTVPRDKHMLPAAIALDIDARRCPDPPGEASIDSELTTFLNEVERHLGRPVVLMPTAAVEARYHLAARIDRNVWVIGDFRPPGYVARPWVLWTATHRLHVAGVDGPVRWVVVQQ
ncbi:glycoside hydrolase family 25 protein [Novosphingobium sp. FSW06-99]|uniref:glycoside hydrolase family 25 protein n=1 Tax=Novosphingobium sp. FSW06-99 TaxID=1739113 RepID=UPI00076D7D8D|nr:glycoside hydrolase family 25 protein [Novosphingobium sp. FSW06-99]KUR75942.1 lysozyme [Novosphingobium sp. FSW06-99]